MFPARPQATGTLGNTGGNFERKLGNKFCPEPSYPGEGESDISTEAESLRGPDPTARPQSRRARSAADCGSLLADRILEPAGAGGEISKPPEVAMIRSHSMKRCLRAGVMGLIAALLAVAVAWLLNS